MRKMACPSKSGIVKAIDGMLATFDCATGMMPLASIGMDAFKGHKPAMFALQGSNVRSNRLCP